MLVARPTPDGTGTLSYTKHYFTGSQRVSSKIGTTTNLGNFLQDWTLIENNSSGAFINLVNTSHDQLTVAETVVTHVYTQYGITPTPTFSSNAAFLPVPNFTATGTETEQFWFHPDLWVVQIILLTLQRSFATYRVLCFWGILRSKIGEHQ